jgi:hypothetical protein
VPPYAEIRRRAQLQLFRQQRILSRLAWAASVVLALGIGWTASTLYRSPSVVAPLAATPELVPAPVMQPGAAEPLLAQPVPAQAAAVPAPARSIAERRLAAVPVLSRPVSAPPEPEAWRTVAWDATPARPIETPAAAAESSGPAPATSGVVVTRHLASGEVMRSVGGSPTDVSSLLSGRPVAEPEAKPAAPVMPPAYSSGTLGLRQDGVATGPSAIPSDSLRAMMRRLNLMLRVR